MAVTIKDVAKKANVSIATVSKVINGSYSISEETIKKVNDTMAELNYHPNLRARNFAKQSTRQIAFVTTLGKDTGFSNPHMFEMMCGIEQTLSEKGYTLIIKGVPQNEVCEYVKTSFDEKLVDGFIIHAGVATKDLDEIIFANNIPHIVLGMPSFVNHMCWIDINNQLAGELATRYLLEKGYKSIAYIGGNEEDKISSHRLSGVLSILSEHDLLLPGNYLQRGESDVESGYHMTEAVLDSKADAIICANNYIAYGCVTCLHDKNVSIPKEVAVITFDDYPFSQILSPKLSVVSIDVYDMGVQAAKQIIQKIKKPNLLIQSYITLPELTIREST